MITLALQELDGVFTVTVAAMDGLLAPTARLTASHTPRLREPSIIVQAEHARRQEAIQRLLSVAAAMEAGAAAVRNSLVDLKTNWKVELDGFRRHGLDGWEQAVAVWPVALRPRWHAAERDLVELVPF